jgi:pyruvate dehydrogenase E2 component (dihydrolipoamide acetyltransferase)
LKLLVEEGETLEAGTPVAIIGKEGESIDELIEEAKAQQAGGGESGSAAEGSSEAAASETESSGRGKGAREAEGSSEPGSEEASGKESAEGEERPRRRAAEAAGRDEAEGDAGKRRDARRAESAEGEPGRGAFGRILASPVVRQMAREHDVDLANVPGSGPGGRIVKRDLEAFLEKGAAAPAGRAPRAERGEPRVEKASSMRRTIARRLTESKREVPHYYLNMDIDAAPLVAARKAVNEQLEDSGEKASLNDFIVKACAVTLRRHPEANVSWVDGSIHRHQRVDVSVAVAIPDGLVTPVIRDADTKGVAEIAREVKELAARARDKKLAPEEMTDGTFSVSNLGMFGIEDFAAVINPPEGAILAVGTVRDEPVVKDGQVVPGKRMRMTMSCDHRVIDGAVGARWLQQLARVLENPVMLAL